MKIAVASGKGGTGKTTVAVNLALSLDNAQYLDCDVEEPNGHLFLKPDIQGSETVSVPVPEIDEDKCTYCGTCARVCEYNAIAVIAPSGGKKGHVLTFPNLCHGCGACSYMCPSGAIKESGREVGVVESGTAGNAGFVQGRLKIGEIMSPHLIRSVRKYTDRGRISIIDAPPGTSCPVIAAIRSADMCLLVTEPTPFGLNDLVLAVETVKKLEIPSGVVINRSDMGDNATERYCLEQGIPVLMRIPFSRDIALAYSNGQAIVELFPEWKERFRGLMASISAMFSGPAGGH